MDLEKIKDQIILDLENYNKCNLTQFNLNYYNYKPILTFIINLDNVVFNIKTQTIERKK